MIQHGEIVRRDGITSGLNFVVDMLAGGNKNALVIQHDEMLQDFDNNDLWPAGWMHLFLHGIGGPLDPDRVVRVSFQKWIQILLERTDGRWRKDRTFLFVVATLLFRREALSKV